MIGARFNGLTAVVTGGAQGIGLAVISRLIAEGARVASWDVLEKDNDAALVEFGTAHCLYSVILQMKARFIML